MVNHNNSLTFNVFQSHWQINNHYYIKNIYLDHGSIRIADGAVVTNAQSFQMLDQTTL